jgi:EpsI family protein
VRKICIFQIVALAVSLCVTGALVLLRPESHPVNKKVALEQALTDVGGWKKAGRGSLSARIVEELDLDDYIFQTYTRQNDSVTVYAGCYFSGKKVGAAHDPQVCYPGQGWKLSGKEQRRHQLKSQEDLEYSRIVAEMEGIREEIVYWFQVDDKSAPNTFRQKVFLFEKRLLRRGEGNAFVRISTSLNNRTEKEAHDLILDFIDSFYPLFLDYLNENQVTFSRIQR